MQKQRLLNIELLRIVAMGLITLGHFYGWFLLPHEESYDPRLLLILKKVMSFLPFHVNTFILISGYFGIKHNVSGIVKISFLCWFYNLLDIGILLFRGCQIDFLKIIFPITHGGWWFINIYVCLLILAPLLNKIAKGADKIEWRTILLPFIIIDVYFGFFQKMDTIYHYGYDIINMSTIYMIGRYLSLNKIMISQKKAIPLFLLAMILNAVFAVLGHRMGIDLRLGNGDYCNPLIILASIGFFYIFLNFKINWKYVSFFSSSAVSIYLCTALPSVKLFVSETFYKMYTCFCSPITVASRQNLLIGICLFVFFMLSFFIAIPFIDKVRIYLFRLAEKFILHKKIFKLIKYKTNET